MKASRSILAMPLILIALLTPFLWGCSGPSVFLDRTYDFGFVERIAVIPFENLSQNQGAGRQATLIAVTELLASEAFAVIEPGETAKVLGEVSTSRTGTLDLEQIKEVGKRLNAQGLVFGTVSETSTLRSGGMTVPTVTVDLRLVETETGSTVWSASNTEGRPGLFASLFGLGGKSSSETMRDCIHEALNTLIK
jgi:curli biogenesis system outer membrane secretion channel CsgG